MMLTEEFEAGLKQLLEQLRMAVGEVPMVVAGGCLRDAIHGQPVKDIDVFIRYQPEQAINLLTVLRAQFPDARTEFDLTYAANPDINLVIDLGHTVNSSPVQVICMTRGDTPREMVERIDLGICQVGYGENGLFFTRAFVNDAMNKTMTVVNCESEGALERSLRRFSRLLSKYPGYRMQVPDSLGLPLTAVRARQQVSLPCKCMTCQNMVGPSTGKWFRDQLSIKEFGISGMCQDCQDSVFGKEPE